MTCTPFMAVYRKQERKNDRGQWEFRIIWQQSCVNSMHGRDSPHCTLDCEPRVIGEPFVSAFRRRAFKQADRAIAALEKAEEQGTEGDWSDVNYEYR